MLSPGEISIGTGICVLYSSDKDVHSPHEGAEAAYPTDEDENLETFSQTYFVRNRSTKSLYCHGFTETMKYKLFF